MKLGTRYGGAIVVAERERHRMAYVLYDPSESTEPDKFMAQVPSFPNCVVWGDTAEETIAILESVVVEMIQVYQERGYQLPPGVPRQAREVELYAEHGVLEGSV